MGNAGEVEYEYAEDGACLALHSPRFSEEVKARTTTGLPLARRKITPLADQFEELQYDLLGHLISEAHHNYQFDGLDRCLAQDENLFSYEVVAQGWSDRIDCA